MNALELADKLDKSQSWMDALHTQYKNGFGKYCALPKEVATMLRQQQEQIEVLKLQNNNYWVMIEILRQKVKAQEK